MATPEGTLHCPDCDGILVPYAVTISSENEVNLNYCYNCGGFWCDHWVANRISYKQFKSISTQFPEHSNSFVLGSGKKCPYCEIGLQRIQGENIPQDLTVFSCPQCFGNWFPKGELPRFKLAQESKLDYLKTWGVPLRSVYQILLPVLVLILIGVAIPATVYLTQKNQEARIMASEYIKNEQVIQSGLEEVIIAFTTTNPMPTEIEYGLSENSLQKLSISVVEQTFHQIKITELQKGKRYVYRIILHKGGKPLLLPFGYFGIK